MSAVYVQTNDQDENRVIAFRRGPDGVLEPLGSFATGGRGDGRPHLTSQGSVVLSRDGRHLLVANAGSGDVSLLAVEDELRLLGTTATGAAPKSVAEHDGLVYVLNTGDATVAGFRIEAGGLQALAGSARTLSAPGADPAQVGFTPDGGSLVVTERGTNSIVRFAVDQAGMLGAAEVTPSSGPTPYGFAVAADGTLVVTEAFGAQVGRAAASSYRLGGQVQPRSRSVGNGRSEICWAVITPDGRYAYTTNFADGAVSRWALEADGSLALEDATAGLTEDGRAGLRDEDLSGDGRYLYAIDADARRIFGWQVGDQGALALIGSWDGLPATVAGMAAS
jgi:6-phosphogluconolactonase